MVNEGTSYHQQVQAITTLRSRRLVDNRVEEKKDEQAEDSQTLQKEKGKQVTMRHPHQLPLIQRHHISPEPHSQNVSRHPLTLGNKERKYKR
jgi:hypothetical protein